MRQRLFDFNLLTGEIPAPVVVQADESPAIHGSGGGAPSATSLDTSRSPLPANASESATGPADAAVEYEYTPQPLGSNLTVPEDPYYELTQDFDSGDEPPLEGEAGMFVYGDDGDLYGDYHEQVAQQRPIVPPDGQEVIIGVRFNFIVGSLPTGEGVDRVKYNVEYNCRIDGAPKQRFCPGPWLWLWLLLSLLLVPAVACGVFLASRGSSRFVADVRFAVRRFQWRHVHNRALMLIVAVSLAWDLIVWTQDFRVLTHHVSLRVTPDLTQMAYLALSDLGDVMAPPAVLSLLVWWLWRSTKALLGRQQDVSAWTFMASKDVMRENLLALREDQALLLVLWTVLATVCAVSNHLLLPRSIPAWQSVPAEYQWFPPVLVMQIQEVPVVAITLLYASYIIVIYQMVSNVALPSQLWCNESVAIALRTSRKPSSPAKEDPSEGVPHSNSIDTEMVALLRPVRWLRYSPAVTAAMILMLITCTWTAVATFSDSTVAAANNITYNDQDTVVEIHSGPVPFAAASICFVGQVAAVVAVNYLAWGGGQLHGIGGNRKGSPSSRTAGVSRGKLPLRARLMKLLRSIVTTKKMGRSHLRRNLLLLVFGLTMLPAGNKGSTGLWMIIFVWSLCIVLLICAAVARDRTAGFDDLPGREGFGLVMLARDLAEALEADLFHNKPMKSVESRTFSWQMLESPSLVQSLPSYHGAPPSCCADHPGGCHACKRLIRRFPATLSRMQETLALSYRWQAEMHVLVHPNGVDPDSPGFAREYFKNGTVSVNMSRWQREQLLSVLLSNGHTYVWVDALCIPASLQPEPGTVLAHTSSVLLTRMMALYSAAATTLVLRTVEEEGFRYHQRAWTMQEYCCAREIIVRSQSASGTPEVTTATTEEEGGTAGEPHTERSHTPEEEAQFRSRRQEVTQRILSARPFWVRRMDAAAFMSDLELLRYGLHEYAVARRQVTCWLPSDLVRALVPMFMDTSVQDEDELRTLVQWACDSFPKGTAESEDDKEAMLEAVSLLQPASGDGTDV